MASAAERARLTEEFVSFTSTDEEFARSFLEASDWNLQAALETFLGTGVPPSSSPPTAWGGGSGGGMMEDLEYAEEEDVVALDETSPGGFDQATRDFARLHGMDLPTARTVLRAQAAPAAGGEDGVRAPILQKRQRLFGGLDEGESETEAFHDLDFGRARAFPGASAGSRRPARDLLERDSHAVADAFYRGEGGGASSMRAHPSSGGGGGGSSVGTSLYDMYPPPADLVFSGTFEAAREACNKGKRWLLVCIQDASEFQSLVLNRDLWSNETVRQLLKGTFLLFQREHTHRDAVTFIQRYDPTRPFPYVCVVDPKTGEKVAVLRVANLSVDALRESFMEQITNFLDRNTGRSAAGSRQTATPPASSTPSAAPPLEELDEDAALAAAVQASLEEARPPSPPAVVHAPPRAEPAAGTADTTTILFRLPDNSSQKRRFYKSDPVSALFDFVASLPEEKRGGRGAFDLFAQSTGVATTSLAGVRAETLAAADVCGSQIRVKPVA